MLEVISFLLDWFKQVFKVCIKGLFALDTTNSGGAASCSEALLFIGVEVENLLYVPDRTDVRVSRILATFSRRVRFHCAEFFPQLLEVFRNGQ